MEGRPGGGDAGRKDQGEAWGGTRAKPGIDVDGPDYDHITDDEDLARAGGVTAFDRIDVQPWLDSKERFSFVSSDPLAADLDCFRGDGYRGLVPHGDPKRVARV